MKDYDVIVIGAGHAGVEAALAVARMKGRVLLLTMNLDSISFMACNPNIGGTAKGHLVKEIDALGGEMGVNADRSIIQLRMLNRSKGVAVQSLRGQADKNAYHVNMKHTLELTEGLDILQCECTHVLVDNGTVYGIRTSHGEVYSAKAVVLACGVYLNSKIIIGDFNKYSGPNGFERAASLTESLMELGLSIVRFKTGTPARVRRSSIDFSVMEEQEGDDDIYSFSPLSPKRNYNQRKCYLTYTTEETHRIIRENIHLAPMYNGQIHGIGPRYCPSIEDKVMRFPDRERHQVFVEPEGLDTEEYYIQGVSTSLPVSVQQQMYRSIIGLENCEIMRYAYAIEYDCLDPLELQSSLMTKKVKGLFAAGQINGSSGYEEAAAQGLMAGINAIRYVRGETPFVLRRYEAYIGVLIDDLVTKGTNEPYRMMTARAEYRLCLRQDNADLRLTAKGREIGLVTDERYEKFLKREKALKEIATILQRSAGAERSRLILESVGEDYHGCTIYELAKRPTVDMDLLYDTFEELHIYDRNDVFTVITDIRYDGYIKKQAAQIRDMERMENRALPTDIDYLGIDLLRIEARQKLDKVRPANLGQASRISGVNPSDITVLMLYLNEHKL